MNDIILAGNLIVNDDKELLLLFRKKHQHYETPGGKVEPGECMDAKNPTIVELSMVAERELQEELGTDFTYAPLTYFDKAAFTIPDGREAIAHKFLTRIIKGEPIINEPELFSELKWLPLATIEDAPISPDLRLFLPLLKERLLH